MGKTPTSTTQNTFPPWLMKALRPLISNSAENMGTFANQGFNVLQGRPAGEGRSASDNKGGEPFKNPDLMKMLLSGMGGAGKTRGR